MTSTARHQGCKWPDQPHTCTYFCEAPHCRRPVEEPTGDDIFCERHRRCAGCHVGVQVQRIVNGTWADCTHCNRPGPQPPDYEWNGQRITHYLNHGNTWQAREASAR